MNVTASTHLMIGNYQALKAAHLSHDEKKYNSNKDIDYSKRKYNTHKVYVDDLDAWKDEQYEEPLRRYNARQKNKNRRFKDYAEYHERQANKGSRNKDIPLSPNRLMIMNFADMESNKKIKKFFMRKGLTEKQYYEAMAEGMDLAVERFNEKFGEHLQITESFTHVNEGSPHVHCDLWAKGTDKFGKPVVDINDALYAIYGKTRTVKDKDGKEKEIRMTHKALWETFRADVDENIIYASMMDAVASKLGVRRLNGIDFYRKESAVTGERHEFYKQMAQEATRKERARLGKREAKVSEKEQELAELKEKIDSERERVDAKDKALNEREQAINAKEIELNDREREQIVRHGKRSGEILRMRRDFMKFVADVSRGYAPTNIVEQLDQLVKEDKFIDDPKVIRAVLHDTVVGASRKHETGTLLERSRQIAVSEHTDENELELG